MVDSVEGLLRSRVTRLWGSVRGGHWWPIDTAEYTFLGNATLSLGAAMFADWQGNEPALAALPVLSLSTPVDPEGFDFAYASVLLARYGEQGSNPLENPQELYRLRMKTGSPLTVEQWERAIDYYRRYEMAGNTSALRRVSRVRRLLLQEIAARRISVFTRDQEGDFSPSPLKDWQTETIIYRFLECQMNPGAPYEWARPTAIDGLVNEAGPILWPGNQWIFLDGPDFEALRAKQRQHASGDAAMPADDGEEIATALSLDKISRTDCQ